MKNLLTILVLICGFLATTQAQFFEMVSAPDTILYNPNDNGITFSSYLKNISGTTDTLIAERISNDLAPRHQTAFAWNYFWFSNEVNSSMDLGMYVILQDQEIDSSFQLTLSPNFNGGTTTVKMRFSSMGDSMRYLEHRYVFVSEVTSPISQENITAGFELGKPYPHPAGDWVHITYHLPAEIGHASLGITDLSGRLIQLEPISRFESYTQLKTEAFSPGIYCISLRVKNQVIKTTRLIVK